MMDAKKALTENDGDMEAAVDWLRTKGLAKAAKKSGRTAAEGLVAVKTDGGVGVAVEVNSETDFVAKNAEFQEMVGTIAGLALNVDSVDELSGTDVGNGKPVSEMITDKIATIGENLSLRRMEKISGGKVSATSTTRRPTEWAGSASSLRLTETTLASPARSPCMLQQPARSLERSRTRRRIRCPRTSGADRTGP